MDSMAASGKKLHFVCDFLENEIHQLVFKLFAVHNKRYASISPHLDGYKNTKTSLACARVAYDRKPKNESC